MANKYMANKYMANKYNKKSIFCSAFPYISLTSSLELNYANIYAYYKSLPYLMKSIAQYLSVVRTLKTVNSYSALMLLHIAYFNLIHQKKTFIYKLYNKTNEYQISHWIMLNNFFFTYKMHQVTTNYFAYKIKLKPGFSSLWRLIRQQFKDIYQIKFKFQHMLTKYINIISSVKIYYKLLY